MRIVCIADTHCHHWHTLIPPGDVLIHAGDLVNWGNAAELSEALRWFGMHSHPHKILVAGTRGDSTVWDEHPSKIHHVSVYVLQAERLEKLCTKMAREYYDEEEHT